MRLCFWARSSLAPVCVTASLQGLRRSSQQVGRGTRNQSFRVRLVGGWEAGAEGRRRQQMTTTLRQLANSSDPGAATTASVPTRSARRLASSLRLQRDVSEGQEPSAESTGGKLRAGEKWKAIGGWDRAGGTRWHARVAGQIPELKRRRSQKRKCLVVGGPGYGRRESSRRALSPCPPTIRLRLARTPFLTSGGQTRVGCLSGRGCAGVCMSFPGSQGLARERPHC